MYQRKECIFCNSTDLIHIYTQSNTPLTFYGVDQPNNYIFQDNIWLGCQNCEITQLQNLIDPTILYSISHNNTYNTPTWSAHHTLFETFIKDNRKYNSILEIGGGNNYLASKLYNNTITYSIVDLFDPLDKLDHIEYKVANCESFDYTNYTTVILSHVFEHLYNPVEFIKRVAEYKVKELFISVPNLNHALTTNNISFIHNEHTFYFEDIDIISIFAKYNYTLSSINNFKNHSIFFYFNYDISSNNKPVTSGGILSKNRLNKMKQYFMDRGERLSTIELKNPTFIIPSGHFGSVIYNYLKDKTKVIGFLDNDISKQNKYLYGTNVLTYPMEYISKFNNIDIILHAGPYSDEIRQQLLSYNTNINLITF